MNPYNIIGKFKKTVISRAGDIKKEIIEKAQNEKTAAIEERENAALKRAYEIIQNEVTKANREKSAIINGAAAKARRELLEHRSAITEEVIEGVKEKIKEFKERGPYLDFLGEQVKSAAEYAEGAEIKVYVASEDIKYKDELLKAGASEVLPDNEDIIGGTRIHCPLKKVIIDNSILLKLKEARREIYGIKL